MVPGPAELDRFKRDLDALIEPDARLGIAVSGGPDSLALLLLAAAARPGTIEAATVDHGLRQGSREEASMVAAVCARLAVPHAILTAEWIEVPRTAIQQRAREERYRLLASWAGERSLFAIATAHHLDDQAETMAMRLARGAGVRGLGGMRPRTTVPRSELPLIRPLLGWRHSELEQICRNANLDPAEDPSNEDEQFERIRVRRALGDCSFLSPDALAASAHHLADADDALEWATDQEWAGAVTVDHGGITYRPSAPPEVQRRILTRVVTLLATEGRGEELRGRELNRLIDALRNGGQSTLRGVRFSGGKDWRFVVSNPRRG